MASAAAIICAEPVRVSVSSQRGEPCSGSRTDFFTATLSDEGRDGAAGARLLGSRVRGYRGGSLARQTTAKVVK